MKRALGEEFRQQGATVWFTGLPASGKSTAAAALHAHLLRKGRPACLLDGDALRQGLSSDLGFSRQDRSENTRRAAHVARLFVDVGFVVLVSLVSPYAADRQLARELHESAGLAFIEVFVDTPPDECERRDPKGLWGKARDGKLLSFTGVDDPYERPASPDLVLPGGASPEDVAEGVFDLLPATARGD